MRRRVLGSAWISALAVVIAGCGEHVDTTLPGIPGSTLLLNTEIQSTIDDSWGRYETLLADHLISGQALSHRIRQVLEADGWSTRPARSPKGSVQASKSGETAIRFGPATSNMKYFVPQQVKNAVPDTPGAERRAVFVAIR